MLVSLAAMLAAVGPGSLSLDCTVPDRRGRPTSWTVKLDQPHGVVEVKLGASSVVYTAAAIYRADAILFDLLDASIAINRADGAIRRTLVARGVRDVVEGTCNAASSPAPEHHSG